MSTRPAGLPHPWGTTSRRKAAPLTHLLRRGVAGVCGGGIRCDQNFNRRLREEQDREFEESLAADRAREESLAAAEEAERAAAAEQQQVAAAAQQVGCCTLSSPTLMMPLIALSNSEWPFGTPRAVRVCTEGQRLNTGLDRGRPC